MYSHLDDDETHVQVNDYPNYEQTSELHGNYSNDVWGGIPENSHSSPSPVYDQN
jgi:hypothetical protein